MHFQRVVYYISSMTFVFALILLVETVEHNSSLCGMFLYIFFNDFKLHFKNMSFSGVI